MYVQRNNKVRLRNHWCGKAKKSRILSVYL